MADELKGLERRVFNSLVREWHHDTPDQIRVELTRSPPYPSVAEVEAALRSLSDQGWVVEEPPGRWKLSPNGYGSKRSLLGGSRYSVQIGTAEPHRVKMALEAAGIPSIGPAMAGFVGNPESWSASDHITAVLAAPSAEAALSRVREVIGPRAELHEPKPYG